MPNAFAYLVFFGWPVVVLWLLFSYPAKKAIFIAITLGVLLLPTAFTIDLPLLPPLDKETITGLSIAVFLFLLRKKFRIFQPGLVTKLYIAYFIGLVITVELNAMPIITAKKYLPGLTHYDAFSLMVRIILNTMPFYLGRYFSTSVKDTEGFFKIVVIMALIYSIPMLYELKMSPQLHYMFYGIQPAQFLQQVRESGYRPMVFIGHGLALAFWFSTAVIAAGVLFKNKIRTTLTSPFATLCYLLVILFLCKTWSAIAYVIFGLLFIFKLKPNTQVKWSLIIASLVILYPVAKVADVFPEREIVSMISQYSSERAQSIQFRFQNEDAMLEHAMKKPSFGWGEWGRNRVYSIEDGRDLTIVDGRWIGELGVNGWFGFLLSYAILLTPLYYAQKAVHYIKDPKDQVYFASLAVILAIGVVDSIPNTGMGPMHLFFSGILLAQSELLIKHKYLLENE
jgi:hypothetical protein